MQTIHNPKLKIYEILLTQINTAGFTVIERSAGSECCYAGTMYVGELGLGEKHRIGSDLRVAIINFQLYAI